MSYQVCYLEDFALTLNTWTTKNRSKLRVKSLVLLDKENGGGQYVAETILSFISIKLRTLIE